MSKQLVRILINAPDLPEGPDEPLDTYIEADLTPAQLIALRRVIYGAESSTIYNTRPGGVWIDFSRNTVQEMVAALMMRRESRGQEALAITRPRSPL